MHSMICCRTPNKPVTPCEDGTTVYCVTITDGCCKMAAKRILTQTWDAENERCDKVYTLMSWDETTPVDETVWHVIEGEKPWCPGGPDQYMTVIENPDNPDQLCGINVDGTTVCWDKEDTDTDTYATGVLNDDGSWTITTPDGQEWTYSPAKCCIHICWTDPATGEMVFEVIQTSGTADPGTPMGYANPDGSVWDGDADTLEPCSMGEDPTGCPDPLPSMLEIDAATEALAMDDVCGGDPPEPCTADVGFRDLGTGQRGAGYAWSHDSGYPSGLPGGPVVPFTTTQFCVNPGELFVFEITYSRHWAPESGGSIAFTPNAALAACLDMGTWKQEGRASAHDEAGVPTVYTETWSAVATGTCCGEIDVTGTYVDVGGTGVPMGQLAYHATAVTGIDPTKLAAGNGVAQVAVYNSDGTDCNGNTAPGTLPVFDQTSSALVTIGGRHFRCDSDAGDAIVTSGVDNSPMANNYMNPDEANGICLDGNCNIVQEHLAIENDGSALSIFGLTNGACSATNRLGIVVMTFDPCPDEAGGGGGGGATIADLTVELDAPPCAECPTEGPWIVQSAFDGMQLTGTLAAGAEYRVDVCFDGSTTPAASTTVTGDGDIDMMIPAVDGPVSTINCDETASTRVQVKVVCVNHVAGSTLTPGAGSVSMTP